MLPARMPRFYLHVHDTLDAIDEEGVDLADLNAITEATVGLRDILAHQVRNGHLPTHMRVRITNRDGERFGVVTFMDAIDVLPQVAAYG